MKSKKWTVPEDKRPEIEALIESTGAKINRDVKGVKEVWRVKLGGSTITMYNTGTLYATPPQNPNEVLEVFNKIAKILGATLEKPDKDFLIGLDETGKGEVLGHSILSGVIFPSSLIEKMDELLGVADTKKKKSVSYWDDLFRELDQLKEQGFNFIIQKIPPWHVDKYNLNKLMDVTYQRILSDLTRKVELENCRITIDDYGIGATLAAFLKSLEKQGAQIVVEQKADQTYVEARLASVISKRDREKLMEAINKSFSLSGIPVGSGNAGDPVTKKWLEEFKKTGKEWPWFVKRSFKNIRELEGHNGKVKKIDPPIRPELLSNEVHPEFAYFSS